jgi:hypothetical protein
MFSWVQELILPTKIFHSSGICAKYFIRNADGGDGLVSQNEIPVMPYALCEREEL